MRSEEKRLRTFRQWPESSPVSATDLAKAGFFFLGPGDRVQCFCCGGILRSWEAEDQPMREHQKFFPTCKFICGEDVGNQQMLPFLEILDYVDGQILSLLQRMDVEEANVLQMGFDHSLVMSLVQSRHLLSGTCYLSVSELVLDLLQVDGEESSSAEEREPPLSTEEQLRRLQEERMCKVCMDKDVSIVFVPCGHLVVCAECAPSLRRCPICRAVIRGSVRTFMS
uniref:RING-type E3 ubiquitin transferase n=1 Tax=Chelonoidis abingdonii TaxID=106734 RepID=A0A8C0FZY0_CHEAB